MSGSIVLFLLSLPALAQLPFNQFVVFGDSLSDNGNLYAGTVQFGLPATPGPPMYATGEYTDGANSVPSTTAPLGLWIEQLAQKMNLPVPQPFEKGGTNYAVAGALTGTNPFYSPAIPSLPYLTDQLGLFQKATPTPSPNALYVFWGGGNDILDGFSATAAAANVQGNINTLAAAGAKYFLWVNLPPVGEVPENINTSSRYTLDADSEAYNQAMTAAVAQLQTAHPGITIVTVDAYSLFLEIAQKPGAFRFCQRHGAGARLGQRQPQYLPVLGFAASDHRGPSGRRWAGLLPARIRVRRARLFLHQHRGSHDHVGQFGQQLRRVRVFRFGIVLGNKRDQSGHPNDPRLLTNAGQWAAADFTGGNAPTNLDGISVSIDGKPALVSYISPTQINAQAPEDSATGNVAIAVTNCKAASSPFLFAKQALAPGLLAPASFNVNGTPYMAATFASDGAYVLSSSVGSQLGVNSRPAAAGDVIIAYGIGFGDVTPSISPGTVVTQSNTVNNSVAFSFGSTSAVVSYSGLAGGLVGLYEFYITIPSGLSSGDYRINVTQNGVALPQMLYLTVGN